MLKKKTEVRKTKDGKKIIKFSGACPVDEYCPEKDRGEVVVNNGIIYACTLNQTNLKNNNNKFYIIQAVKAAKSYYCFTRWGRVGVAGAKANKKFPTKEKAIKEFKSKFRAKTKNSWDDKDNFEYVKGKYMLMDMDYGQDAKMASDEADDSEEEEEK
eukprot:UN31874